MKERFHSIKKIYIVAILFAFVLLIVIGLSSASYLNQSYKRGVVRNREEEAIRFTSNHLSLVAQGTEPDSYANRIITYREDEPKNLFCEIDVRNYIPGSANLINDYTITYTLQVTLKRATPDAEYRVGNQSNRTDANGNCVFILENQILQGRSRKEKTYTVTFYKNDLNELNITVDAIPVNTAYTGNQFLAAKIFPCTKSETQPFSCVGKFADQDSGKQPSDFDAYNYEVILANGRAKVTLTWDNSLYEIDPFFKLKLVSDDIKEDSEGKLVFIMDQTKGNDSYIITFYKKDKTECNKLSWSEMTEKISISAEELAPEAIINN